MDTAFAIGGLWSVVIGCCLWLLFVSCWLIRVDMRLALVEDEVEDLTDDEESRSDPLTAVEDGWVPAIVKSGLLKRGWVTVDSDGSYCHWLGGRPVLKVNSDNAVAEEWIRCPPDVAAGFYGYHMLNVKEWPKVVGREAIWEVSDGE